MNKGTCGAVKTKVSQGTSTAVHDNLRLWHGLENYGLPAASGPSTHFNWPARGSRICMVEGLEKAFYAVYKYFHAYYCTFYSSKP